MSGIFKNVLTFIFALFDRKSYSPLSQTTAYYWVMPWDAGLRVLKSDKYLQFAESAQLDYLVKTKLFSVLLSKGISFVNAAQLIKFSKPINMFSHVKVITQVIYLDDKFTYFEHVLSARNKSCATVLVKMKFKKGKLTVNPTEILGAFAGRKAAHLQAWDDSLAGMA
jgi:acyl-CoA thioesterase FadM